MENNCKTDHFTITLFQTISPNWSHHHVKFTTTSCCARMVGCVKTQLGRQSAGRITVKPRSKYVVLSHCPASADLLQGQLDPLQISVTFESKYIHVYRICIYTYTYMCMCLYANLLPHVMNNYRTWYRKYGQILSFDSMLLLNNIGNQILRVNVFLSSTKASITYDIAELRNRGWF